MGYTKTGSYLDVATGIVCQSLIIQITWQSTLTKLVSRNNTKCKNYIIIVTESYIIIITKFIYRQSEF